YYSPYGKTEKIIRTTFDSNGKSWEFSTNFYYNKSNLLDSILIFNPKMNSTYSKVFDNYSILENKIQFSYDGIQNQEILLDNLSNIKEIKCYTNRIIKYNSSGFKTFEMSSTKEGNIIFKKEITYNENNYILNYSVTDKNSNPKFLNFEITRNNLDEIIKVVNLANSDKEFQNLEFIYENDEHQNWTSMKYNLNRYPYDQILKKIEEFKYKRDNASNFYEYYQFQNLLERYIREKYFSKINLSQVEVRRTIDYF